MAAFHVHARTVSLLTFVSRISGLLREAVLARVFGVGPAMDAFAFAFMLPNLFRRLFGEGALSSAFLPVYSKMESEEPRSAGRLAWLVLGRTTMLLAALTLVGELVLAMVPAESADRGLLLRLAMVMLPYMPMVCLVALLGAVLQVHHRFGPTAAAPIILNVGVAGTALVAGAMLKGDGWQSAAITWVSISVLLGGVIQLVWAARALSNAGLDLRGAARTPSPKADEGFRTVLTRTLPMVLGMGVLQINTFIDGLIASYPTAFGPTIFGREFPLPEGSMATLSWAQRLYEFPLGVFGIAVATAIFPALSRQAGEVEVFRGTLIRALRLSFFIGLPASLVLMVLARPSVAAVFQGGDFTAEDSSRVAWVLAGYALAIWAYSINQTLTRAFYARGENMIPVRVAVSMVVLNFLLNITLIWTPLGVAGLAVSTAICAAIQCCWLSLLLSRRIGDFFTEELRQSAGRTVVVGIATAAVALGAALGAERALLPAIGLAPDSWGAAVVTLAAALPLGAATALACAKLLGMRELAWALGREG